VQALERESLGLELEQEREIGGKQLEPEQGQGRELQPQGVVGEELDMAFELEW